MKRLGFLHMLLLALHLHTMPAIGRAQERSLAPIESKYSQVINRAFQFSRGVPAEFQGVEHRVVVRFLPSFGIPESQIVFLKKDDGTVRVIRYRLKDGTRPIAEQCDAILDKNPRATVEDILKRIDVERVEHVANASYTELVEDVLHLAIPANFATNIFVADGTIYQLWIQTPQNEIHAVLSDGAYGDATDSVPIIRWIKAVQVQLQKQE